MGVVVVVAVVVVVVVVVLLFVVRVLVTGAKSQLRAGRISSAFLCGHRPSCVTEAFCFCSAHDDCVSSCFILVPFSSLHVLPITLCSCTARALLDGQIGDTETWAAKK